MDPHQAIELSSSALRASITPWGGYLTRLRVANGRDVVLAHRDEAGRKFDEQHLGCLVGRSAGRIRGGMFELDGWHHQLPCNGTDAHLHGGLTGFGACEWTPVNQTASMLELELVSPAGHENHPGTLEVRARFSIVEETRLRLELTAVTDRATLCNLTWHPYFNLAGHQAGHVGTHHVSIEADHYLPLARDHCPTGDVLEVADTPFDLRSPVRMQTGMVSGHPQIVLAEGYDHFFPIRGEGLRRAARVVAPDGRVAMELHTDQPGVQFYTGNSLHLPEGAKAERGYRRHDGFCLEAQGYPDAPNHRAFPDSDLRPRTTYRRVIEYRFETPGR